MPELPTCLCVRGLPPYDRLTAIYQAAAELSGDESLPDSLCVAGVPPFDRFAYIYAAFRVIAEDDTLPSMECVEGESPQDQVSRIYQAAAIYADDPSLPSYLCVRGLPIWHQWQEIYRALYIAVGEPEELIDPLCTNASFDILSEVFCALTSVCVTPVLESASILDDILTLTFSTRVTGNDGFDLEVDGVPATLTYLAGEGTDTLVFSSSVPALTGDAVLLDYAPGDVTNRDCPLASFSDFVVTNNTGVFFTYLQPGGVFTYFQPDGVSRYLQP